MANCCNKRQCRSHIEVKMSMIPISLAIFLMIFQHVVANTELDSTEDVEDILMRTDNKTLSSITSTEATTLTSETSITTKKDDIKNNATPNNSNKDNNSETSNKNTQTNTPKTSEAVTSPTKTVVTSITENLITTSKLSTPIRSILTTKKATSSPAHIATSRGSEDKKKTMVKLSTTTTTSLSKTPQATTSSSHSSTLERSSSSIKTETIRTKNTFTSTSFPEKRDKTETSSETMSDHNLISQNENGMEGNHVHIDIQDNIEETDHERVTNNSVEKKFLEVDAVPESVPLIASATPSVTGNDSSITENYTSTSTIPCENPYKLPNPLVVKIDSEDQTSPDILTNKIEDEKINDKSNQCQKGDASNDCQFSCIKDDQISLNVLLDPTPERLENDSFLVLPIVDPDSRDAEISKSLNESENKSMITSDDKDKTLHTNNVLKMLLSCNCLTPMYDEVDNES